MTLFHHNIPNGLIEKAIERALEEDLGPRGDVTSQAICFSPTPHSASITARKSGRIAGLYLAERIFKSLHPETKFLAHVSDGGDIEAATPIATITAPPDILMMGERVALNFLGHLSGIATTTKSFVETVQGTGVRICCTRKTTPGLRVFEKAAVRAGGGHNHRFGLDDAVLIKDNHIALAGGLEKALERAIANKRHLQSIEVEVDNLEQLEIALKFPIDAVLLDNMAVDQLREAVRRIDGQVTAEASGGVRLETVRQIAKTGVDLISIGALTHSAANLDVGLDIT